MRVDWSNEPSRVRRDGVTVLWTLAVTTALPALGAAAQVAGDVLDSHQLPRFDSDEVVVVAIFLPSCALFTLAAEGLRRATRWAVGLAMMVTIGAGALSAFVAFMIVTHMMPYDDVRRKQAAATIGLVALAVAMFKLAAGVARCGPYLEEVRGRTVRAFEPVMTPGRPAGEPGGEPEGQ